MGKPMRESNDPARALKQPPSTVWPIMLTPDKAQALALQFQFDQTQWWSLEQLLQCQLQQVALVIRHAARYSPFWKPRLAALKKRLPGSFTMNHLRALPLLTRSDIQDAGKSLFSTSVPPDHGKPYKVRTSGSTGTPITVLNTQLTTLVMQNALSLRGHIWHGRDLTAKNVDIRTAKPRAQTPRTQRWSPVPGTGPTVRVDISLPISEILEHVLNEDPVYLQTHPYTLLGMIERSREIGAKPSSLREVRTFGEALEPRIRAAARTEWGVPVVDSYSALEFGMIAHQCPESENLHVMSESVLLEVL